MITVNGQNAWMEDHELLQISSWIWLDSRQLLHDIDVLAETICARIVSASALVISHEDASALVYEADVFHAAAMDKLSHMNASAMLAVKKK